MRHGIGPAEHAAGVKLTASRGHADTPEHPERKGKSDSYLRRAVIRKKEKDYAHRIALNKIGIAVGASPFNGEGSRIAVERADLSNDMVRRAMQSYLDNDLDVDDISDDLWRLPYEANIYSFLYYHEWQS